MLQVLLCAIPVGGLLAVGMARMAGLVYWGLFTILWLRLAILGRHHELIALLIALFPFTNLLRGFAPFFSIIVVLLGVAVAYYNMLSPGTIWQVLQRYRMVMWMFVFAIVYYIWSLILTGKYEVTIRIFELAFSVLLILILGRSRKMLGPAIIGIITSACIVGLAMLPHIGTVVGERLGEMVVQGYALGNPVQLGIPLALAFLALTVDRGRWLNLERHLLIRVLLLFPTVTLLALTASRASWLVAIGGLVATMLLGRSRVRMLVITGFGALAIQLVLISPFGGGFQKGIERTFSEDRSAGNKTSGRSDQWVVSYYAFTESVGRMIYGYGPGMGQDVYASYSRRIPTIEFKVGSRMALHSLYMQVGVEAGLIGLIPLVAWLLVGLYRTIRWSLIYGLQFPLVCLLGFILVAMTTSGFDTVSGSLLGVGLLATSRRSFSGGPTQVTELGTPFDHRSNVSLAR